MTRLAPTQERAFNTRTKLVTATREVVAEQGRDLFTTSQVAERAGTSVGVVYRYFENRVDLLRAAYPDLNEGLTRAIDPIEARELVEAYEKASGPDSDGFELWFEAGWALIEYVRGLIS